MVKYLDTHVMYLPFAKRSNLVLSSSRQLAVCKSANLLVEQGRPKKMANADVVHMRVLNTLQIITFLQGVSPARGPTEVYLQIFNEIVNQLTLSLPN
jgi:hypothetical protein